MAARKKTGGRKAGTPNKATVATRDRIEAEGDPVGLMLDIANGKPIKAAPLPGADTGVSMVPTVDQRLNAAKWLGERSTPAPKGRFVVFDLPSMETAEDVRDAANALMAKVASGEITPDEGQAWLPLFDLMRSVVTDVELLNRIEALEQAQGGKGEAARGE